MGVSSGGPWPPWIFKHGTNIVDRGLKVLFFGFFFVIFQPFAIFSVFFPLAPPGKFSADALVLMMMSFIC